MKEGMWLFGRVCRVVFLWLATRCIHVSIQSPMVLQLEQSVAGFKQSLDTNLVFRPPRQQFRFPPLELEIKVSRVELTSGGMKRLISWNG